MDPLKYRNKIREHAKSKQIPKEQDGIWLDTALPFRHGNLLEDTTRTKILLDELLIGKRKDPNSYPQKLKDLSCLLANLKANGNRPCYVSMSNNAWTHKQYRVAGRYTIEAIRLLADRNLIGRKRGCEKAKRFTRIWAKEELKMRFLADNVEYTPPEYVVLKDANGDLAEYPQTEYTLRVANILRTNHEIDKRAGVLVKIDNQFKRVSTALHAVYLRDFDTYGRCHTATENGYQQLRKEERRNIVIGNEPTTELDYSGLHPRILYAWQDIQYDYDPYMAVSDNQELRGHLKILLLALLNSDTITKAVKAGNWRIYDSTHSNVEKQKLKRLLTVLNTSSKILVKKFIESHPRIAHYFGQADTGLKLMRHDSVIALDIINEFNSRNIPILSIYDSFIVQQQYRELLYDVMNEMYSRNTGGFSCEIK